MPKISVIMPIYNTDPVYLKQAIESVFHQTYKDFELLLIDDASEPYIREVIESYHDKRLNYIRLKSNSGAAAARNIGIEKSKGEYIALLDSDDIALPERLEKQVKYMEKHPKIGCMGTSAEIIGDDSDNAGFTKFKGHKEIERFLIFINCAFCNSSIMLRKSVLTKNHIFYNSEFVPAEDYGFYISLIGKTQFAFLNEVLIQYRYHHANISHKKCQVQLKNATYIKKQALTAYLVDFKENEIDLLCQFLTNQSLSDQELPRFIMLINRLIDKLRMKNWSDEEIRDFFKKKIKKLYYRTPSIKGQCVLLQKSPMTQFFKLPFYWRMMCLITRGLFRHV